MQRCSSHGCCPRGGREAEQPELSSSMAFPSYLSSSRPRHFPLVIFQEAAERGGAAGTRRALLGSGSGGAGPCESILTLC